MRIKYFEDTDTTLLEFSSQHPVETREVSENVYIDFDEKKRVVSITLEHVGQLANMQELIFQRIPEGLVPA